MKGEAGASGKFVVKDSLTIRNVEAACRRLRSLIQRHAAIELDVSRAAEVDVTGVQLVLAARASAQKLGKALTVVQPLSDAFRAALVQGGFLAAGDEDDGRGSFWLGKTVE